MGERFGNYELIRRIAQGGMAEVFLARFSGVEGFERQVVVKKMLPELVRRPEFVTMFLDEARLAARFHHPNIVEVDQLGECDGTYFMAMEFVDGPHLGSLFAHSLRQRNPLPIPLCCYIVARAAEGLHHAHELKDEKGSPLAIVHRDVSPQNILISRDGEVKVMDFGVAKAASREGRTRTGVIKGKVGYMSPEQCLANPLDRRTDVFALGVVLYELCTRRRLFRDKSDLVVMQRITQDTVPPPSTVNADVPPELDAIIMRAIAKDARTRTPDALTLSDELDTFLASTEPVTRHTLRRWIEQHAATVGASAEQGHQATPSWSTDSGSDGQGAARVVRQEAPVAPPVSEPTLVGDEEEDITNESTNPELMVPAANRTRSVAPLLGLAAVVLMMAGGGLWLATRTAPTPVDADPPVAAPGATAQPAAPTRGALRIMTEPPGASVTVLGTPRGVTSADGPLVVEDLAVDAPVAVVVELAGYMPWRNEVPLVAGDAITLPVIKLQPVPAVRRGTLHITSEPTGQEVLVDGAPAGRTPLEALELDEGSHLLTIEATGRFKDARRSVDVKAGEAQRVHLRLDAARTRRDRDRARDDGARGKIVVDTSPYWTNVYLGSRLLGPTPVAGVEVPAGRITLRLVRKDGCSINVTRTMDVRANETVRKAFTIDAKDARGSCQ